MSIPLPAGASLRPLVLPARADAADGAQLHTYADVRNAHLRELTGRDDEHLTAAELLPMLRSDSDNAKLQWSVEQHGETIGCVALNMPLDSGARAAYWMISLLRRSWSQGIGSALEPFVETGAREHGRDVLQLWIEHAHTDIGEVVPSPTGYGAVPRDHAARFLLRHGHTLGQVERVSALDWTAEAADHVTALRDEAAKAASGYRVVQWMLPTPAERAGGYAWMKSRMSTDAPAADMEIVEERWDEERVARHDRRYLDRGRRVLVTAAEHAATGELCAYNELTIGADLTLGTQQEDTLVLSEHRDHRLGMLVKTAGLLSWHELFPGSPRVITWNAEENRPMLTINEAIGFAPIAYQGAWKKVLT